MKYQLALALIFVSFLSFSQSMMPVIKAGSNKAKIYEQQYAVSDWGINPKIKLDVHSTGKLVKPALIKFKTDIDSISFKLAPGEYKDFVVLLNGKDSCLTRIQSPEVKNLTSSSWLYMTPYHFSSIGITRTMCRCYLTEQTPCSLILIVEQLKFALLQKA